MFENVPNMLVPMMWFRQTVSLDDDLAKDVRLALNLESIGIISFYTIAGVGVFVIAIGLLLLFCGAWKK